MIKRILVTGDLVRPMDQRGNVETIFHLVSRPIALATGIEPELWLPSVPILGLEAWAETHREDGPKSWVWEAIGGLDPEVVVVGFEMPPPFLAQAEELGVTVVDLAIHPIRFMQDLMLSVTVTTENDLGWMDRVDDAQVQVELGLLKARLRRMEIKPVRPNTLLVVGQNRGDRSLIDGGRNAWFDDRAQTLRELAEAADYVLYKPHPYGYEDRRFMEAIGRPYKGLPHDACIYRYLMEPNLTVCGMSSSVLEEAKWFGRKVVPLLREPDPACRFAASKILDPRFWGDAVGYGGNDIRGRDAVVPPAYPDMLRQVFGVSWGFVR